MIKREDIVYYGKKKRMYYFKEDKNGPRAMMLGVSEPGKAIDDQLELEDEICIGGGVTDGNEYLIIDECKEAWDILAKIISQNNPQTLEEKCICVQAAINSYFGDLSHGSERIDFYKERGGVPLSSFAGKNMAACVERAALSHMMLKSLGINSTFRISDITINGSRDNHAYNLIEENGVYYIYDSTQPMLKDNLINPLIAEIPREVYEGLKVKYKMGAHIVHYGPLTNKEYDVIYNPSTEIYEISEQIMR